ncbi:hypothetical protein [Comamonas serinivorans]|uniref:hypothetical protein n=1 Tax=Comamonas serinivorans TaxID=1082851 RepID=UPI001F38FED9|nr:hypothetical protein [Comamonas serinivorans]
MSVSSSFVRSSRLRRFRVDVGTIITLVVVVQSLLLLGLGYWGAQRLVGAMGESVHRADHLRVEDKIHAFLAKAASVVSAMAASPSLEPAGIMPSSRQSCCGCCCSSRPSWTASTWPMPSATC